MSIRLEDCFKDAWALFKKSPEVFITIAFAILGASMLLGYLPVAGPLANLLVAALGPAAFFLAAQECSRTGTATFDSLKGLTPLFPQLLALLVVKTILITLGFVLFILPGIYLAVLLCFAELFVVVENRNFVDAMRASKELVQGHWFSVFGLCLVVGIVAFSGALLIGLGLLLTLPFAAVVMFCAFRQARTQVVA